MKQEKLNPVDRYAQYIHEGIAASIINFLFKKQLEPALEDLKSTLPPGETPLEAGMAKFKKEMDHLNGLIDDFCKNNPDHPSCIDHKKRMAKSNKKKFGKK